MDEWISAYDQIARKIVVKVPRDKEKTNQVYKKLGR